MEENQKIISNNTAVSPKRQNNETQIIESAPKKKPFKKKRFNGHLRTNNKHERFIHPNEFEIEEENIVLKPKPIYSDLFYFLRQKFANNKTVFFELLKNVLTTIEMKNIKEGELSLLSYSAMYEKTDIFQELAKNYPQEINKKDFEKHIFPACLNKNEETLRGIIEIFDKNIPLDNEFIKDLMSKMAQMSYRENNNKLILNWINKCLDSELCNIFWGVCFKEKNISLINTALNNPTLSSHLKHNFAEFSDILDKIGKKIEIFRKLNSIEKQTINELLVENEKKINIHEEPKIYLGNKEEQMQNLTKQEIVTKVTIKRRKVVA